MIEETAVVTRCDGEFAEVEAQRKSSCSSCGAKGSCGSGALSEVFGRKSSVMRVRNPIGAHPGDQVVVGLDDAMLTRASLAAYAVPVLALLAGAILGQGVGGWLGSGSASEAWAIVGGIGGLAIGFLWLSHYSRRLAADPRYQPVILRQAGVAAVMFHHD